ncbi:putative E3 ubiquitin-protein ligase HIP1 [Diplonema papillatum]|nr:putative E3 ubiquitin-protein ligase HIP1 [Diplonema papillatum]KAJ9459451.1 putative E3 ubiquitin-protein ligase HIP1 [Diplonema papillatum]
MTTDPTALRELEEEASQSPEKSLKPATKRKQTASASSRPTRHRLRVSSVEGSENPGDKQARLRRESRARLGIPQPEEQRRLDDALRRYPRRVASANRVHGSSNVRSQTANPQRRFPRHGYEVFIDVDNMTYEELLELQESIGHVPLTITKRQLSSLPLVEFEPAEAAETMCAICQMNMDPGDQRRVLPCDDKFHSACIDQWLLNSKGTCPCCSINLRDILA